MSREILIGLKDYEIADAANIKQYTNGKSNITQDLIEKYGERHLITIDDVADIPSRYVPIEEDELDHYQSREGSSIRYQSWHAQIRTALADNGEKWADIVYMSKSEEALKLRRTWNDEEDKFTIWTKERVYFPATYDCDYWVTSVQRNPCEEHTKPVGG